jgi:hypothetical protein
VFDGTEPTFLEDTTCLSGCTNLTVTVTDPSNHGKAVAGAEVSASVTPIGDPFLKRTETGYLCNASKPTSCGVGRFITGLRTDRHGHVRLLYWAPGLLSKQTTTLTVKAQKPCSHQACALNQKSGERDTTIRVSPNVIYQHDGTLTLEQARALGEWADGGLIHLAAHKAVETLLEQAIEKLVKAEELAHKLGRGLERISGVIEIAHLSLELKEQYGFMAMFLNAFDLSAVGLGDAPDEHLVTAGPSNALTEAVAGDGHPPLHLGAKGLLWRYGQTRAFLDAEHKLTDQEIHLAVYEISECRQGRVCGPGYLGRPGIQPSLYFRFSAEGPHLENTFIGTFVLRYNAQAWMDTQHGLVAH